MYEDNEIGWHTKKYYKCLEYMNKMITTTKKGSIADFWTLRKPKGRLEIKSVAMHKQPHTTVSKMALTNKRWTKTQQNH